MSEHGQSEAGPMGGPVMKSLDGVTSPVSYTRGPGDTIEVVMYMSPKGFALLETLAETADIGLEDVIARSLILYRDARKAINLGKVVGVASDPEALDVRFIDL